MVGNSELAHRSEGTSVRTSGQSHFVKAKMLTTVRRELRESEESPL